MRGHFAHHRRSVGSDIAAIAASDKIAVGNIPTMACNRWWPLWANLVVDRIRNWRHLGRNYGKTRGGARYPMLDGRDALGSGAAADAARPRCGVFFPKPITRCWLRRHSPRSLEDAAHGAARWRLSGGHPSQRARRLALAAWGRSACASPFLKDHLPVSVPAGPPSSPIDV